MHKYSALSSFSGSFLKVKDQSSCIYYCIPRIQQYSANALSVQTENSPKATKGRNCIFMMVALTLDKGKATQ